MDKDKTASFTVSLEKRKSHIDFLSAYAKGTLNILRSFLFLLIFIFFLYKGPRTLKGEGT
jgi:hypothetical protein